MRTLVTILLALLASQWANADSWETPRSVRPEVDSLDAKFDEVWGFYRFSHPKSSGEIGWNEQITSDTSRKLTINRTLLSPLRDRYFYVEVLPDFTGYAYHPNYDYGQQSGAGASSFDEWDNNPTAMRLHIYRLSGERLAMIDLPRSYCGEFGTGQWLGDNWIWLRHRYGHRSGNFYSVFVNVTTGEKRVVGWTIGDAVATPDGQAVTFQHNDIFYVDFRPVYPILRENLPDFGTKDSWQTYVQRHFVRKEKRPHEQLGPDDLRVLSYDLVPDGRQAVLFVSRPGAGKDQVTPGGSRYRIVTGTHVVLIDLVKLATATSAEQYTRTIPLPDEAVRLERDNGNREFRVKGLGGQTLWHRSFSELTAP